MDIKRIHCKKCRAGRTGAWVTRNNRSVRYILCDDKASEWWDVEGVKEIYVTLSNEPHVGAYRITSSWLPTMEIEAENGEGTHRYMISPSLYHELKRFNPTCYMGIEII